MLVTPDPPESEVPPPPRTWRRLLGLLLMAGAATWGFYQIFLVDVFAARFVRSLQHPLGYLLDPRLAQLSVWGNWLGSGVQLVLLSAGCWLVGRLTRRKVWEWAGRQALLAHGLTAILTNGLKRALGRPRPKFSHAGEFQLWPSLDNGFDSFPSGHTSAAFAVATVFAASFPRVRWLCLGIALAIACSRVLRSSHFPTDVVAGASIGLTIGWLLSHPLAQWRQSLADALRMLSPWVVGVGGAVWMARHAPLWHGAEKSWFALGAMLGILGFVGRLRPRLGERLCGASSGRATWSYVAGVGLCVATGVPLLMGIGGMLLTGRFLTQPPWMNGTDNRQGGMPSVPVWADLRFGVWLALGFFVMWQLHGPFSLTAF